MLTISNDSLVFTTWTIWTTSQLIKSPVSFNFQSLNLESVLPVDIEQQPVQSLLPSVCLFLLRGECGVRRAASKVHSRRAIGPFEDTEEYLYRVLEK